MPESSVRKEAAAKKQRKQHDDLVTTREEKKKVASLQKRRWVPPVMITMFLIGLLWLVVYYVAGQYIPIMKDLNQWNMGIGMGFMAVSFGLATMWE